MKRITKRFVVACCLLAATSTLAVERDAKLKFTEAEVECLAKNIYHESYGEPHQGKRAVAYVTLNRVMSEEYPDSICAVVKQRNQFEWVRMGKWNVKHKAAYKDSLLIAYSVIINYDRAADPTNGATLFHATRISPKWNWRKLVKTVRIGNHIFYKERS